jgi:hypothetical protein
MSPAAWLVSRDITASAGPWDERLSLNDDGEYFCRVVAASDHVQFVEQSRCYYRQSGPSQLSRTFDRQALQSFALSLSLSVDHLLAVEESARTRAAALAFVEHCAVWFNPHDLDLVQPIAHRLGRFVEVRPETRKEQIAQAVFGEDLGSRVLTTVRKAKLAAAVNWDRFWYRLTPTLPL